ncbi:MAG: DUF362 domain-containing protein [Candidatus Bathyarchaeia archaeon]
MSKVIIVKGNDAGVMVSRGLSELDVRPHKGKVVIKPNLIVNRPYPTTTSAETVEAIARYCKRFGKDLVIAEGSGWTNTYEAFRDQGYLEVAEKHGVKLVDLNRDRYERRRNPQAMVLKEFEFPSTLRNSYIISAAVLKVHSITTVTLSLKNMLGATIGRDKGRFHDYGINESIVDINLYKTPDLAIIDGRTGNVAGELGGRTRRFNLMVFSEDPVAADAVGASILGLNPLSITHLRLAQDRALGVADLRKIDIVEVE